MELRTGTEYLTIVSLFKTLSYILLGHILLLFYMFGGAGDGIQGLKQAREVLYLLAIIPALLFLI